MAPSAFPRYKVCIMWRHPLAFLITLLLICSAVAGPQPNIVFIIADDMAWDDSGVYGNPHIPTPHIDRLAAEGMRFNNAFLSASSCSPSRCSIITGRYPHNTHAEELHWPLPADQSHLHGETPRRRILDRRRRKMASRRGRPRSLR